MVVILFDLEGTLVQTIFDREPMLVQKFRLETREKLLTLGVPQSVLSGVESSTLMRNKASDWVDANMLEVESRKFHHELDGFIRIYELWSAHGSKLFPDALPTLRALKELEFRMGLITNTSREAVKVVFSRYGLGEFFEVVVTREDVRRLKPDPEAVLKALQELGGGPFTLIGDSLHDSVASKEANGLSITVNRSPSRRIAFRTDFIISSLVESIPIIKAYRERVS